MILENMDIMMKRFIYFIVSMLFVCFITISCKSEKSRLEKSAGNLTEEIEYVYDYFTSSYMVSPAFSAKRWCEINCSWNYEDCGPRGFSVYTENEKALIKQIYIKNKDSYSESVSYSIDIHGISHENVCQVLKEIFGEPLWTKTLHGGDYCQWETDKNIEVSVEKSDVSRSSFLLFAVHNY